MIMEISPGQSYQRIAMVALKSHLKLSLILGFIGQVKLLTIPVSSSALVSRRGILMFSSGDNASEEGSMFTDVGHIFQSTLRFKFLFSSILFIHSAHPFIP